MISVILPTYRNPKYLDLCLYTIIGGQANENEIIVVVDGYYEESKEVLTKHKDSIKVLDLEENMGMQHAINYGVWNAEGDKLFIINDDNVFPKNWDVRLEEEYDDNLVVTVNQIEPTGPGMFNFPVHDCGTTVENFDLARFMEIERDISKDESTPDGNIFPFLLNKKWFMAVGGFDTWYDSPNWCDADFFLKLELLPHLSYIRTHLLHLYHFGSVSTKKNSEKNSFIERERLAAQQYEYKWGIPPTWNTTTNSKLPSDSKFRGFKG